MAPAAKTDSKNDFSKGSIIKNILGLAVPMTLAQLINVLYNIVDRIYIGRIPKDATMALTGLGSLSSHHLHGYRLCQPFRHGRRSPLLH